MPSLLQCYLLVIGTKVKSDAMRGQVLIGNDNTCLASPPPHTYLHGSLHGTASSPCLVVLGVMHDSIMSLPVVCHKSTLN